LGPIPPLHWIGQALSSTGFGASPSPMQQIGQALTTTGLGNTPPVSLLTSCSGRQLEPYLMLWRPITPGLAQAKTDSGLAYTQYWEKPPGSPDTELSSGSRTILGNIPTALGHGPCLKDQWIGQALPPGKPFSVMLLTSARTPYPMLRLISHNSRHMAQA
jgi:hypothetical protein